MARVNHPASSKPTHVPNGNGVQTPMYHTGHGAPPHLAANVRDAARQSAYEANDHEINGAPAPSGEDRMLPDNWGAQSLSKLRPAADVLRGNTEAAKNRFVQPTMSQTAQIPPPGLGNPRGMRGVY